MISHHWSPQISFHPWQGENYGSSSSIGIGILILGESHYGGDYSQADLTKWVIKDYLSGQSTRPIFTKLGNCIFSDYSRGEAAKYWNQLAFYNFLQFFKGDSPKCSTSAHAINQSKAAFAEIINGLQPDLIIAVGKTMWTRWLPDDIDAEAGLRGERVNLAGCARFMWRYQTLGRPALCGYIVHPSSGGGHFKAEQERFYLQTYIAQAKKELRMQPVVRATNEVVSS